MELKQALLKIDEATHGDLYDFSCGGWMVNATETTETLTDFEIAAKSYAEPAQIHRGKLAGFDFIYLEGGRASKEQPPFSFSVIDLGAVRFALYDNLTYYAD
jgi:hypothetical protein